MFAHITTFQLKPGVIDDLIRIVQDTIAPAIAEQPGFGGMTLLTNMQAGHALAIGLWASETDLPVGEYSSMYHMCHAGIQNLIAAPLACEVYEVSVQVALTQQGTAHIRGI
jgi:heme-degrading monooxygenase HmoA